VATLLILSAWSPPRRVGDGGEYFVMALQLGKGHPPALSADELRDVKSELAGMSGGFESSLLEYPDLIASDGRQDFLHFFLYPLIVAPAVPAVRAVGLHPNWAFTLVNALLLGLALFLAARSIPLVACTAAFVSPIIWWVDKAHTEAFLFAAVVVAAVTFRERPVLSAIAFALAGAQNAALGATFPVFAVFLWWATRRSTFTVRAVVAIAAGALIVAMPFVYTWLRLGRLSPMIEYAQRTVPTSWSLAAFLVEPNIGLAPNAPVYALMLGAAVWLIVGTLRGRIAPAAVWWWPAVIQLLLLVAWSQNPNANHGGTPGVNRWVLSLLALSVPWIAEARRTMNGNGRVAFNMAVAVTAVLTAAAHLPWLPENYREPSALARRVWQKGWMAATPAEVFAERSQGREPASTPAHDGTCHVLLIADQQAPVQCAPPVAPPPAACRVAGAMCYAIMSDEDVRYVPAPANGFFYQVAQPSWPAGGPLAHAVHALLRQADPNARVWRTDNVRRWRERLVGADIGAVLSSPNAVVIYITRTTRAAAQTIEQDLGVPLSPLLPATDAESPLLTNIGVVLPRSGGR
jgi:hypothetical protein